MREIGGQPDEIASSVVAIRLPRQQSLVAKALQQPEGRRSRKSRRDTKRAGRYGFRRRLMDEEIDEHVPSRFAEQIVSADKLSAQKAPPPYALRVGERQLGIG